MTDATATPDKDQLYEDLPEQVIKVAGKIGLNRERASVINDFVKEYVGGKNAGVDVTEYFNLHDPKSPYIQNKAQKKKKPRKKSLPVKQRRLLFKLPRKSSLKFSAFSKANQLWHQYFESVVGKHGIQTDLSKVFKCDYHGAYFIVCASSNPALVGTKGYVVQETKHTLRIISMSDKVLTVPKDKTVFAFENQGVVFKLCGSHLKMSAHHRSKAKLKSKKLVKDV